MGRGNTGVELISVDVVGIKVSSERLIIPNPEVIILKTLCVKLDIVTILPSIMLNTRSLMKKNRVITTGHNIFLFI